jgi:Mg2+-importing ATPase
MPITTFWALTAEQTLAALQTGPQGLSLAEAQQRLARYGHNILKPRRRTDALTLLLAQFDSPLIIVLILSALLSFFLHEPVDAAIILGIVLLSGVLGFWQEKRAADAVAACVFAGARRHHGVVFARFGVD